MILYTVLVWSFAVGIFAVGMAIHRGNLAFVHSYHQTNVKEADQKEYGRALAKGLFAMAVALLLSGQVALWGKTPVCVLVSIGVMFAGIVTGFILLIKAQKRFNRAER